MYFTYVLYSESFNRIYVGFSHDPAKRLWYHNEGLASMNSSLCVLGRKIVLPRNETTLSSRSKNIPVHLY
ncbi:MAG: GIY-YIG nuclease family protein [Bacteroidetes bacterium]|nr:GIY-YIG nuclease family protein [Bacteroidota bacterium]